LKYFDQGCGKGQSYTHGKWPRIVMFIRGTTLSATVMGHEDFSNRIRIADAEFVVTDSNEFALSLMAAKCPLRICQSCPVIWTWRWTQRKAPVYHSGTRNTSVVGRLPGCCHDWRQAGNPKLQRVLGHHDWFSGLNRLSPRAMR